MTMRKTHRLIAVLLIATLAVPASGLDKEPAAFAKDGGSGGGDDSGHGGGDNSGPGGGKNSGSDDRKGDDDAGRTGTTTTRKGLGERLYPLRLGPHGERIEIDRAGISVLYPDGFREVIRNGVLELTDPQGRQVVKRAATRKDMGRIRALLAL